MRRSLPLLLEILNTARGLPNVARDRHIRAYDVTGPTTVFIRASHARVTVQRTRERRVQFELDLLQSFGWEWAVDNDADGIYLALKRKRVMGALSYAHVNLIVPEDADLVFHLTPGHIELQDVEGRLAIDPPEAAGPPRRAAQPGAVKAAR